MMTPHPVKRRKKLIEVAIPLEAVNQEAQRRKQKAPKGWPTSFHKWWAQKPLAASRAVLFAQLVDDPSEVTELFPTESEQDLERDRLFYLIARLCLWDSTHNQSVINEARSEIKKSWLRFCNDNINSCLPPEERDPDQPPPFIDPFAGSGSIPLSAQWLGLESYAADLNPVSVLINKCIIEIPALFAGAPRASKGSHLSIPQDSLVGSHNISADILYYGEILRGLAEDRLKDFYPAAQLTGDEGFLSDPSYEWLKDLVGSKLRVVAWIWCRTVLSPNPAFSKVHVPLTSTYLLSSKVGKEVYINPIVDQGTYRFEICYGRPEDLVAVKRGTTAQKGFRCILSGDPISNEYIRDQGMNGLLSSRLMAIVADSKHGRVFLPPTLNHEEAATEAQPIWEPNTEFFVDALGFRIGAYGMSKWSDIYTPRQLTALSVIGDCIKILKEQIRLDAVASGFADDAFGISQDGKGAKAYSEAITTFLACALDRMAYYGSSLTTWLPKDSALRDCMPRQALSMSWEFAESNPFGKSSGDISTCIKAISACLDHVTVKPQGRAIHQDAALLPKDFKRSVISTDPPYFDAVGFADLSDYFYVWERYTVADIYPDLYATISTPKSEEIVSVAARHGGKNNAQQHFVKQMNQALCRLAKIAHPAYPITIYYAFKQIESKDGSGYASTGWDTFLTALLDADLKITGTWPIQTEGQGRMRSNGSNALTSSIVLVCEQKDSQKPPITRSEFRRKIIPVIESVVRSLEKANTPPVDLAQAIIGPCMEPFSSAKCVLNGDDSMVSVRDALEDINKALDEYLAKDEASLDSDSRFALTLFESYGYAERPYGDAEGLAKARNISVSGVAEAGILRSVAGKVKLLERSELENDWDPTRDKRLCIWEATQQLIRRLEADGEGAAAELLSQLKQVSGHGDFAANCKALAYRLYNHCEKSKQAEEARSYNGLVMAWEDIERQAASQASETAVQASLI